MSHLNIYNVLLKPHLSEKSASSAQGYRQYVFKVVKDAPKPLIKQAVEKLFNVKVKRVCTVNVVGHVVGARRRGRGGRQSDWKKAYVSLESGHELDFVGQS